MKNSNDIIGNRTRELPTSSAVPQPTAPPRAPLSSCIRTNFSSSSYQVLFFFFAVTIYLPLFKCYSYLSRNAEKR